jgi:hypothetical protein
MGCLGEAISLLVARFDADAVDIVLVADPAFARIDHGDLTALLFAQGRALADFVDN